MLEEDSCICFICVQNARATTGGAAYNVDTEPQRLGSLGGLGLMAPVAFLRGEKLLCPIKQGR